VPVHVAAAHCESVSAVIIGNLGVEKFALRCVPRARHATRGINDNRAAIRDEVLPEQWSQRGEDARWITPRIADEWRVEHLLAHQFREPIRYTFAAVPRTKISRKVDGPRSGFPGTRNPLFGSAMRKRAENQSGIAQTRALGSNELNRAMPDPHGGPALIIRCRERELELGMFENECAELATSIAACSKHSYGYSIHLECIIIRQIGVNGWQAERLSGRWLTCYPKRRVFFHRQKETRAA
jgi:hypothetical protein